MEWLGWVVVVTLAMCWMAVLAYMALGPYKRNEREEPPSSGEEPQDGANEKDE
jgi:hypothetical protein